jgi:AcrR family transcriptional regulator
VTFYLHYRDKQELLLSNVNAMLDELMSKIAPLTGEKIRVDVPPESMIQVFQYLAENARFFKILLGERGISFVVSRLRKYLAALTIERLQPAADMQPRVSMETLSQYAAGSLLGLIAWWLENDMPISPEEIAHQVLLLTAYGVYWGAGITPPEI